MTDLFDDIIGQEREKKILSEFSSHQKFHTHFYLPEMKESEKILLHFGLLNLLTQIVYLQRKEKRLLYCHFG